MPTKSLLLAGAFAIAHGSPIHLMMAKENANELKDLPETFDTRLQWFGCGHHVYNQGGCGNCWAVSAVTTLNDRFCIHTGANGEPLDISEGGAGEKNRLFQDVGYCVTKKKEAPAATPQPCRKVARVLSPQILNSCMTATEIKDDSYGYKIISRGCVGGEAHEAWAYFQKKGLTTMTSDGNGGCTPYVSGICGLDVHGNGCHSCASFNECADSGKAPKTFKVSDWGWIHDDELVLGGYKNGTQNKAALKRQVENMMREIATNGPIHACFDYYENFKDFFDYNPLGIYNSTENAAYGGGHCVTITGWGTDRASGLPYWLIRNSWSSAWAVHGYFRFLRGAGLSGMEEMEVFAGCPENSNCKLTPAVRPYPRNHTWQLPHNGGGGGGKWVKHDPQMDVRAQSLAQKAAALKGLSANSDGLYNVRDFQTRVTNRLEAKVVVSGAGENGEESEETLHFEYAGDGEYAPLP